MATTQTLIEHAVLSLRDIEDALYFRARMGMRGFLEVPEPKVTLTDDGIAIEHPAFIWHPVVVPPGCAMMTPTKSTHGGRASFYDLTDEATVAQVLAAKEAK